MSQEGLWQCSELCLTAWAERGLSHQPPSQVIPMYLQTVGSACGVQVPSVVTTGADGDWSHLSAALQCKVLTRSPVVPLYSKNITIKKKPTKTCWVVWFFSSSHGSQAANSFPLGVFTGPGIQRLNWIFSALPLHASDIFYSWCKSDGEDCNYRLTGARSWSPGGIALVKAIRKQHSKTQNLGNRHKMYFSILYWNTSSVLGKQAPKSPQ